MLLSSSIFPICKALGKKCIRCFAGQYAIPNSFLLYCFNTNKAKRFIVRLVVRDSWPLFKPRRLKRSIGRFFVPKLLLWKRKSLWVIRLITQLWQKQVAMIFSTGMGTCSELQPSTCISKMSFDSIVSLWSNIASCTLAKYDWFLQKKYDAARALLVRQLLTGMQSFYSS